MAKILNLDAITTGDKRSLKIDGKQYPIEEMTVENFLETTRAAENLAKNSASLAEEIEATIGMITRSVPTIDRNLLAKLPLAKLRLITDFVNGSSVEEGVEEVDDEGK